MGWCSGTEVFDRVMDTVTSEYNQGDLSEEGMINICETLKNTLEDKDWDCHSESEYWDDPVIGGILGNDFEED